MHVTTAKLTMFPRQIAARMDAVNYTQQLGRLKQEIYGKDQPPHFGFMHVILLRGDQRHVSATQVAIFRVVTARTKIHL
jgi:hypothetical protein